jgi:site-specific DNA-adenine methylase
MSIGIPYMGSKRKLSAKIVDKILSDNPNCKYVYDLFGGGGAISFEFLKRGITTYYNELNTGVVELLKKIQSDGVTDEFYEWIDRDTFHKLKDEPIWKGGLVATCWSFGNNKNKGYLFSKANEEIKKPLHNIIVNKCPIAKEEFLKLSGIIIDDSLLIADTVNERRLIVMRYVKSEIGRLDLEQLERLKQLQQLTQVQSLERVQSLEITNLSYEKVIIDTPINKTVIYLDPPYAGTAKYKCEIDHDALDKFIASSPYKIYMSGYDMDMPVVAEFSHRSTLSATANNKVIEKLFCNEIAKERIANAI